MDSIQAIWLFLMKTLYDWNSFLVFTLGIIISILLVLLGEILKSVRVWGVLLLFLTILAGAGIRHAEKNYTYVPDIDFGKESFNQTCSNLKDANLRYLLDHQGLDHEAIQHIQNGEDLSNHNFKTADSNPEPGAFVKQKSSVTLSVTWADILSAISLTDTDVETFDAKAFYGDVNYDEIYPYNAYSIELSTLPLGLRKWIDDAEGRGLTVYPTLAEKSIVRTQLVNYFSGEIVDEAACYLGDSITFPLVQRGIYYLIASCDGYHLAVSEHLVRLDYDDSLETRSPYLELNFEKKTNNYLPIFRICLQDAQGNALSGVPVTMRVVSEDDPTPRAYRHSLYVTDENGYISNREGDYLMPGGILDFQVCEGYVAQILLVDDEFISVPQADGPEVCIIVE